MKKTIITTGIVVIITFIALAAFVKLTSGNDSELLNITEAKKGIFEITVSNIGELIAEKSLDIRGPEIVQNRNFRVAPVRILDIVPEGTMVRKGDYVASLDRSNFENTLKDEITRLNTMQAEFEMKILDTTVVMSTLRDDIRNQDFTLEEAAINLEQAKYEPPAIQRQAETELDKLKRFLEQKNKLYFLRRMQSITDTKNLRKSLEGQRNKVKDLAEILADFTITSPADGMITYKRDRLGDKIKSGSSVHPFDPVVATLPDISIMISKIYVSEVDINKVKPGQEVQITVDAFKEKLYTGFVESIANIGEQLSNSDSKVFEVHIKMEGSDPMLRPSMTTSNKIIISTFDNVIYVPIESVHAGSDNIPFVYTKSGTRQIIVAGVANDKNIIIEHGLAEGTPIFLNPPDNLKKFTMAGNELISILREKENTRKTEIEKMNIERKIFAEKLSESKALPPVLVQTGQGGQPSGL